MAALLASITLDSNGWIKPQAVSGVLCSVAFVACLLTVDAAMVWRRYRLARARAQRACCPCPPLARELVCRRGTRESWLAGATVRLPRRRRYRAPQTQPFGVEFALIQFAQRAGPHKLPDRIHRIGDGPGLLHFTLEQALGKVMRTLL